MLAMIDLYKKILISAYLRQYPWLQMAPFLPTFAEASWARTDSWDLGKSSFEMLGPYPFQKYMSLPSWHLSVIISPKIEE